MASMGEDLDVGLEEGMSWLLARVLDEERESKDIKGRQQYHPFRTSPDPVPVRSLSKSGQKLHQRPRNPAHRASGGPGMQAVFLESGQRSCGTGFFLPRKAGINFQPSKRPACSPVLLPSRVIQALNLNVHALGCQLSPRQDLNSNPNKGGMRKSSVSNKNGKDVDGVSPQCGVYSQTRRSSPETFLPKEWSY